MQTIQQTYTIQAPAATVWRALVDPTVIDAWGAGPAVMDANVGTQFTLWGGDIWGTNTKVVPEQLLEQDWWSNHAWDQPSKVSITLQPDGNATTLTLVQTGVLDEDIADTEHGWRKYYFGALQALVES